MSESELPATLAELVPSELCVTLPDGSCQSMTVRRVGRPENQTAISKQCDLWAFVWASSSVLGDLLVQCLVPTPCAPIVVEIGAGSGVGGLAAAAFTSTARVVCTDLVPDALRLIEINAAALGCIERLSTRQLDWGKFDAATATLDELLGPDAPGLVVGADICYIGSNIRPILRLFQHALRVPGRYALLVDPGRPFRDDLEDAASDFGLRVVVRRDFADLPTPVACMKACTVFLLAQADDASVACGAAAPGGAASAADTASPVVGAGATGAVEVSGAGVMDGSPGGILLSRLQAALDRLAARRLTEKRVDDSRAAGADAPMAASAGAAVGGGAAAVPVAGVTSRSTPAAGPSSGTALADGSTGAVTRALPAYTARSGYTLPSVSRPP